MSEGSSTVQVFDERAARRLEHMYATPDIVQQRNTTLQALALHESEHVLDIGVGPGYLARQMAEQVGLSGRVCGIDVSAAMVSMASQRCADLPWVSVRLANALALPFEEASFNAAVSTQVYEYVPDMDRALAELYRVLRPGGRALIVDTDWASVVLHSKNPALTERLLAVWDAHVVDPFLPRRLRAMLTRAGFTVGVTAAIPIVNAECTQDTYSHGFLELLESFAGRQDGEPTEDEVSRWRDEIRSLDESGEYFFSLNRYLFVAHKPKRKGSGARGVNS